MARRRGVRLFAYDLDTVSADTHHSDPHTTTHTTTTHRYLFAYDLDSNVLFNAASPEKEGHNVLGLPDANGKLFYDALVAVAADPCGRGWVDYAWPRPGEAEPSQKWTFAAAVSIDGKAAVLMSGFYS